MVNKVYGFLVFFGCFFAYIFALFGIIGWLMKIDRGLLQLF
jgi:hypothetical protein